MFEGELKKPVDMWYGGLSWSKLLLQLLRKVAFTIHALYAH